MTAPAPEVVVHVRGRDLLKSALSHPGRSVCPGEDCGLDLMAVGIVALAYVFEVCTCATYDYPHLVEQLWHRDCLVDS